MPPPPQGLQQQIVNETTGSLNSSPIGSPLNQPLPTFQQFVNQQNEFNQRQQQSLTSTSNMPTTGNFNCQEYFLAVFLEV